MTRRSLFLLLAVPLVASPSSEYDSARRKIDLIEKEAYRPGTRVALSPGELNAYAEQEVKAAVPDGVRNPKVELGSDRATGSALVDFARLQRAQGKPPGWLMQRLLEGERPVKVTARIRSAAGKATVDVESVEISGMTIDGGMLDYLIKNYLLPMYPDAKIGRPFELGHRIERLEVRPAAVGVLIGR